MTASSDASRKNDNKLIISIGKHGTLPNHCELLEDHKYESLHLCSDVRLGW
jgi:hypothetical protein